MVNWSCRYGLDLAAVAILFFCLGPVPCRAETERTLVDVQIKDVNSQPPVLKTKPKPNPPTPWNATEAYQYGFYSSISYCKHELVRNWTCNWCIPESDGGVERLVNQTWIDNTTLNLQGVVGVIEGTSTIVAVFRGSVNMVNWKYNLMAGPVYPTELFEEAPEGSLVHRGILVDYLSIRQQIKDAIRWHWFKNTYINCQDNPDCHVRLIGHSLGGAIAGFTMIDMMSWGQWTPQNARIYTYGAPRMANDVFTKWAITKIGTAHVRLVNRNDVIPSVPPRWWNNFTHLPGGVLEIQCKDNKTCPDTYYVCKGVFEWEDERCLDKSRSPVTPGYDHSFYFQVKKNYCMAKPNIPAWWVMNVSAGPWWARNISIAHDAHTEGDE